MGHRVAVLLPTYNGAEFVEHQVKSLANNATSYTVHWLDDHSTDNTREIVRTAAADVGIPLVEWHQAEHQGWPATFFKLMECVEADIYLFCDQDDIWQPGKIDATVESLRADVSRPVLCFSVAFLFYGNDFTKLDRALGNLRLNEEVWLRESMAFTHFVTQGNTMGFTRTLRDYYCQHRNVARAYATDHDWWMYLIAVATGEVRMLHDAPTTLHRRHMNNLTKEYMVYVTHKGRGWIFRMWKWEQRMRRARARNARGFLLASSSLPPSEKLERLIILARLMATSDRRQSSVTLIRLARLGAIWGTVGGALWRAGNYLLSDATRPEAIG